MAGPDGALWFTNYDPQSNSIGRITTTGTVTNYTDPGIRNPVGIVAGPDGALWFTNDNSIGRITAVAAHAGDRARRARRLPRATPGRGR